VLPCAKGVTFTFGCGILLPLGRLVALMAGTCDTLGTRDGSSGMPRPCWTNRLADTSNGSGGAEVVANKRSRAAGSRVLPSYVRSRKDFTLSSIIEPSSLSGGVSGSWCWRDVDGWLSLPPVACGLVCNCGQIRCNVSSLSLRLDKSDFAN
jgi:hypothetical protein